jgi:predicted DNA-binding transcriptional regulator AlpA
MPGTHQNTETPLALSVATASKLSSLSKPHLWNEIRNGNLPVKRPGGSRRTIIMMDDFINYLRNEGGSENAK